MIGFGRFDTAIVNCVPFLFRPHDREAISNAERLAPEEIERLDLTVSYRLPSIRKQRSLVIGTPLSRLTIAYWGQAMMGAKWTWDPKIRVH